MKDLIISILIIGLSAFILWLGVGAFSFLWQNLVFFFGVCGFIAAILLFNKGDN
jgi:hypothetical protein